MPRSQVLLFVIPLALSSAGGPAGSSSKEAFLPSGTVVNKAGSTVATRFEPPAGFRRVAKAAGSFAEYLSNAPLKPWGSKVYYFDKTENTEPDLYAAVLD